MMKVTWILTTLSIIGAWLNSSLEPAKLRACYLVWTVANIGWIASFCSRGLWAESALFSIYLAFSIRGFRRGF